MAENRPSEGGPEDQGARRAPDGHNQDRNQSQSRPSRGIPHAHNERPTMADMFDYLEWRGDLTFGQDPFNEVDSLVLCQLSYLSLGGIVPAAGAGRPVSVATAAKRFALAHADDPSKGAPGGVVSPLTPRVLELMATSERFAHATLSRYEEHLDEAAGEQFAALCIRLGDGSTYVAFRGTDDTFAGWREDFSMSFSVVGSQRRALAYLEDTRRHVRGPLRVGGHSKGGNLAVYASALAGWATRRRIRDIWVHDGPGFVEGIVEPAALQAIEGRTHRYVPEFCVVGQFFDQPGPCEVVASATSAVMQHSATNWQVLGNRFVRVESIDERARHFGEAFADTVRDKDATFRRRLTDALFGALAEGGTTLGELAAGAPASYLRVARAYRDIDPDIRQAVEAIVGSLVGESVSKGLADASASLGAAVGGLLGGIIGPRRTDVASASEDAGTPTDDASAGANPREEGNANATPSAE